MKQDGQRHCKCSMKKSDQRMLNQANQAMSCSMQFQAVCFIDEIQFNVAAMRPMNNCELLVTHQIC